MSPAWKTTTVPAIETLEKFARGLEVLMYQLFYDGEEPPKPPITSTRKSSDKDVWGSTGKDAKYLEKLRRLLSKINEENRKLLLQLVQRMARP